MKTDMKFLSPMFKILSFMLIAGLGLMFSGPAKAQCSNPDGVAGEMVYNADHCVMQSCDGTQWMAMGAIPSFCAAADVCSGTPSPGYICADGSIFVGMLNVDGAPGDEKIFVPAADLPGTSTWNNGTSNWTVTGANSLTDGLANTTTLTTAPVNADTGAPYAAAEACAALTDHGQAAGTWYLPSRYELDLIYDNLVDQDADSTPGGPLGDPVTLFGFDVSGSFPGSLYWSSSEFGNATALYQIFSDGYQGNTVKNYSGSVRCARRN